MATVADYVTFGDDMITLQPGSNTDNTYNVTLPTSINRDSNAIMTLRMEAESPKNLQWNAAVNGTELFNLTHSQDRFGTVQEVFSGSILKAGNNTVTVKVLGGSGRLKVSDFALHHQVNV